MDTGLCLHQEREFNDTSKCQDSVLEIADYKDTDFLETVAMMWSFYKETQNEDLAHFISIPHESGNTEVLAVEAQFYKFIHEDKARIKLARIDGEIVGYLLYHLLWGSTLIVHHLWITEELRNTQIGKRLVESVGEISHLIFQTSILTPPFGLFNNTKYKQVIGERGNYKTWLMKWEKNK